MRSLTALLALCPLLALPAACVGPPADAPDPRAAPRPERKAPRRPATGRPVVQRLAPPAASAAQPAPTTQPVPTDMAWQDRPRTPGDWSYSSDAAQAVARFSADFGADGAFAIRCDRAGRRLSVSRAGAGQGAITIRTSQSVTSLPAAMDASAAGPRLVATRAASDGVFDQIAYSRGKFAVEVAGQPLLILPPWAEVARVVEECRG